MNLDRIGKYRIVGKIGQGAMGEVYKAHDPLLNRYVALKTISPSLAADSEFRERFKREAQSAARLNHPNIVTVFDFGEESGITYMAMELLEGLDLREALRRRSLGHLGRKLEVMVQLCDGLAFAHSQGVVHRDLKPGNVHIQPTGHVKVLDFGLARLGTSDITRTGTVMGTPHYMSPEQVRGERADARSDVFSLGALFYEILSGHRAFEGGVVAEVLQAIVTKEPEPLRRRMPDVPAALVPLVERALAKSADRRFRDAGEMGQALGRVRDSLAGETLAGPGAANEAERTILTGAGATLVLESAANAGRSVAGANALDLEPVGGTRRRQDATVRPELTVASGPETEVPARSRGLVIGAVLLVAAALAGVGLWMRSRAAPAPPPGQVADETVGILTETLLMSKVELARADLDNRDYPAAVAHAREALAIDEGYADAREILERAETAQKELAAAADEAVAAFEGGDTARASSALSRVLALDPRHPVADKLSVELNRFFRSQAEDARGQARNAKAAAEAARAAGEADFRRAASLLTAADGLSGREQYAVAAQKYLESRNAFDVARTAAEARRATSLPSPSPPILARVTPTAPPTAAPPPPAPTPASASTPLPTPSVATMVPTPSPSAPLPDTSAADTRMREIERVLAGYERAYETLDVAALRSVMDLGTDQEKKLREAFKAFKSYDVEMSGPSVEFEGDARAKVRVARQDTVNGRRQPPVKQTFVLGRQGGAWRIVSYSFER
ncbi:MAG TPA: serine/threonine-protein kinase [Vicinamibacteria bacterium]|nr:serine/threonine-protein kinase [Vicinamibacteria bacterium]